MTDARLPQGSAQQPRTNRDQFILSNMGLVHSLAHRLKGRGIEYEELVSAGCVGLLKAANGFEPERGLKFSTYAVPVILGEMKRLFRETIMEIARATGTAPDIRLHESYPGVVNGDAATKLAEETATALLGAANVVRLSAPTMTTEDFGYFIDAATGAYYHIGAGCTKPLHNPAFLPDERAIFTAAAVHAAVAERFLNADK